MKHAIRLATTAALLAPLALAGVSTAASAQQDTTCGHQTAAGWVTTACPNMSGYVYRGSMNVDRPGVGNLTGTIVAVDHSLVTVQVGPSQRVVMDIRPAASNGQTGPLTVGRSIIARGYWDAGHFMAVSIG